MHKPSSATWSGFKVGFLSAANVNSTPARLCGVGMATRHLAAATHNGMLRSDRSGAVGGGKQVGMLTVGVVV